MTIWNRCSVCSNSSCPPQRNQTALQTSNGWRTLTSQERWQTITWWTWILRSPRRQSAEINFQGGRDSQTLSLSIPQNPSKVTRSMHLVFISISYSANSRAILQSLVRSSDKNSDGAMDFEELKTFGDFNLVYNIWPQHLQMARGAEWGMRKWVIFFIQTSLLDQPLSKWWRYPKSMQMWRKLLFSIVYLLTSCSVQVWFCFSSFAFSYFYFFLFVFFSSILSTSITPFFSSTKNLLSATLHRVKFFGA